MDNNGASSKRGSSRNSFQSRKIQTYGNFVGFEDLVEEASRCKISSRIRMKLDLDSRFFPDGLMPGSIVEIKGQENCGKTFLLTYVIADFLFTHLDKKAIIIDTAHQFEIENLVSIMMASGNMKESVGNGNLSSQTIYRIPALSPFLDRLIVIKCKTPEEFLSTAVFKENSLLKEIIDGNPEIALIAIDTVDCYSFSDLVEQNTTIDLLEGIKENCSNIPLICTTISAQNDFQPLAPDDENELPFHSNIKINSDLYTHTLHLFPDDKGKDMANFSAAGTDKKVICAHLRSRSKQRVANIAGSGAIHRVKFSIFSDMLWVF